MNDKPVHIVKASNLLQAKVGRGAIDEKRIARSQKIIDGMNVDFIPIAEHYLVRLEGAQETARAGQFPDDESAFDAITAPVMELKANAGMFEYALVGALANVMLNFLESLERIDDDVLDIVEAHTKTLRLLLNNGLKGEGGDYGVQLQDELKNACRRYFTRRKTRPVASGENEDDAFFIDG